jgi:hypothetical protein
MKSGNASILCLASAAALVTAGCIEGGSDVGLISIDKALTSAPSGALMPFGGQDETCVAVVGGRLQVAACGAANETYRSSVRRFKRARDCVWNY